MRSLRSAIAAQFSGMPRIFWWLWSGALVSSLATFVFPFLALYLMSRGFGAQRTGLLVALLGVGSLLAGPVSGTISDHFGRRPAVLIALIGSALAAAWLGVARSVPMVAPGVMVFGLCSSMVYPVVNATVADLMSPDETQRAYGLLYWAQNLGIGISAWLGGAIATRSWLLLFLLDAATTLVFAALVWRRVPETRPAPIAHESGPRGWRSLLADRALIGFLAAMLVAELVFWQFLFALPIAMARDGLSAEQFGRAVAANCLLIVLVQPWSTRALQRFDSGSLLAAFALLLGAGFGAYAACKTAPQYLAATLVWSVGEVVGLPAASALVARLAPTDLRGRYQGAFSLSMSAAMTIAPALGGIVIERFGMQALWMGCLGVGLAVAAAQLALGAARRRMPRSGSPGEPVVEG